MTARLTYDVANMLEKTVKNGITAKELDGIQDALAEAHEHIEAMRREGKHGFFDLPFNEKTAKELELMAKDIRGQGVKTAVVVGIGGSSIGSKTILGALDDGNGVKTIFLDNPDPESVFPILSPSFDWKKTVLVVISKSGRTLETTAIFDALWKVAKKTLGDKANEHVFIITDSIFGNPLFERAKRETFHILQHPLNVGGRFSVLSVVGLFPAALAGISVKGLLKGAREMEEARRKEGVKHISAIFAVMQYIAMRNHQKTIHALMPYADRLEEFVFWFCQLWAESLGKNGLGQTPLPALGTIDQHSQVQLFMDGPDDKVVTFIGVEDFSKRVKTRSGLDFGEILKKSQQGTGIALASRGHLNGALMIPSITPESLGALFQFFMTSTSYLGELLGVDAYNQPGVESGKKEIARLLGLEISR